MGKVLWLTGLSGAGKTTISNELYDALPGDYNPVRIDGDELRKVTNNTNFSHSGRFNNIKMAVWMAEKHPDSTFIVSLISPYRDMREYAKISLGNRFVEIYVQCSLKECIDRDPKGLYAKALAGEIKDFTGIHQIYEEPINPDIIVNTEFLPVNMCVEKILREVDL